MKITTNYIAALLLPLLLITALVQITNVPNQDVLYADGNQIKPGKRKATLVLSDGRKVELSENTQLIYTNAGGVNVKVDSTGIVYEKEIFPEVNNQPKVTETTKTNTPKEKSKKPSTKTVTQ